MEPYAEYGWLLKVTSYAKDTKSNEQWALEIEKTSGYIILRIGRITGKYQGAGFYVVFEAPTLGRVSPEITCFERKANAEYLFDENLAPGAYCEQIIHGTFSGQDGITWAYNLP